MNLNFEINYLSHYRMSSYDENPWFVSNLDEFLMPYYCCPECDDKYDSKESFVLHAFEKHPKAKDCLELRLDSEKVEVICKKQSDLAIPLKFQEVEYEDVVITTTDEVTTIRNKSSKNHSCKFCSYSVKRKKDLETHILLKHKDLLENRPEYNCKICDHTFADENRREQHMAIVHGGIENKPRAEFKCDICKKPFPTNSQLHQHVQKDHSDRPELKCEICSLTFSSYIRKIQHMTVVHEGVKSHVCNDCGQAFGWRSNLQEHIDEVHGLKKMKYHLPGTSMYKNNILDNDENQNFLCASCDKTFNNENDLLDHISTDHAGGNMSVIINNLSENVLERKMYQCELCDYQCIRPSSLKTHVEVVHEGKSKPKQTCVHCGKDYADQKCLAHHIKVVHEGARVKCNYCVKTYTNVGTLKDHVNAIHKGELKMLKETMSTRSLPTLGVNIALFVNSRKSVFSI